MIGDSDKLSGKWILGIEFGVLLQVISLFFIYYVGSRAGDLALSAQVTSVGGLLVLVPVSFAITVLSTWQDIVFLRRQHNYDIAAWPWLIAVLLVPIVGGFVYLLQYGDLPANRGISGQLRAGSGSQSENPNTELKSEQHQFPQDNTAMAQSSGSQGGIQEGDSPVTQDTRPSLDIGTDETNTLPDYETIEKIHTSDTSEVKCVRLSENDSIAALKYPKVDVTISEGIVESFVAEAETWSQLDDHENIVSVYGWGTIPHPWLLLEYMEGGNYGEKMDGPLKEHIEIINAISEGLYHSHEHGITHLDVKPQNILLSGDEQTVKIADWGSAQRLLINESEVSKMTIAYAAPEQLDPEQFGKTSPRTDIFQLGIVAYEVLTGTHPFTGQDTNDIINAILAETPQPPSKVEPSLPNEFDPPIMTALSKQQSDRYESILYFRDDLAKIDI